MKTSTSLLIGSVCSGIEAASVAWEGLCRFQWLSETAKFPADFLKWKYPDLQNVGDMFDIPQLLRDKAIPPVDVICAGTPCQAFSLAGKKQGLNDSRGNLTLRLIDIVNENDCVLKSTGSNGTIVFWENVEGVLKDKTNAFAQFVSMLSGSDTLLPIQCSSAGILYGAKRNVAWRVLDAKHFGVPQQRKRVYLLAGDKCFHPEDILFEFSDTPQAEPVKNQTGLCFELGGHTFEFFREYTDCLYSSYGTKWNGNAAAYNGSLFVFQNQRLRRFSPLECERLMGFPDNYTDAHFATPTTRYQAVGNSWVVPVVKWIGQRLFASRSEGFSIQEDNSLNICMRKQILGNGVAYYDLEDEVALEKGFMNTSPVPNHIIPFDMRDIVDAHCPEQYYISPVGCYGIIRRAKERNQKVNKRLELALAHIAGQWNLERIEAVSKIQPRGNFVNRKQVIPL